MCVAGYLQLSFDSHSTPFLLLVSRLLSGSGYENGHRGYINFNVLAVLGVLGYHLAHSLASFIELPHLRAVFRLGMRGNTNR